jgi:starch synthase (maltosyl-transferring)
VDRRVLASRGKRPVGRIQVMDVEPSLEGGRWPVKSVLSELFPVTAAVVREGHDAVGADAVLTAPDGTGRHRTAPSIGYGWLRPTTAWDCSSARYPPT